MLLLTITIGGSAGVVGDKELKTHHTDSLTCIHCKLSKHYLRALPYGYRRGLVLLPRKPFG